MSGYNLLLLLNKVSWQLECTKEQITETKVDDAKTSATHRTEVGGGGGGRAGTQQSAATCGGCRRPRRRSALV